MRLVSILALLLLAGCGDVQPVPTGMLSTDPASGEVRARVAVSGEEAVTLRSGQAVPVNLAAGFVLYPGARVVSNTVVERYGASRVLLVFETADALEEVMILYRGQAEAAGAVLTLDLGGRNRASLGGRTAAGLAFSLSARRVARVTRVELSIG